MGEKDGRLKCGWFIGVEGEKCGFERRNGPSARQAPAPSATAEF